MAKVIGINNQVARFNGSLAKVETGVKVKYGTGNFGYTIVLDGFDVVPTRLYCLRDLASSNYRILPKEEDGVINHYFYPNNTKITSMSISDGRLFITMGANISGAFNYVAIFE